MKRGLFSYSYWPVPLFSRPLERGGRKPWTASLDNLQPPGNREAFFIFAALWMRFRTHPGQDGQTRFDSLRKISAGQVYAASRKNILTAGRSFAMIYVYYFE